jgi:bacterioferritin-associated ferredoxin
MIVCSCNVVSDEMIKAALNPAHGDSCPRTPGAVYKSLGRSPCCGRCFTTGRGIDEFLAARGCRHGRVSREERCESERVSYLDRAPILGANA